MDYRHTRFERRATIPRWRKAAREAVREPGTGRIARMARSRPGTRGWRVPRPLKSVQLDRPRTAAARGSSPSTGNNAPQRPLAMPPRGALGRGEWDVTEKFTDRAAGSTVA